MSLKQKLSLLTAGGIVATSLAMLLLAHMTSSKFLERAVADRNVAFAQGLTLSISRALADEDLVLLDAYVFELSSLEELFIESIRVRGTDGTVLVADDQDQEFGDPAALSDSAEVMLVTNELEWNGEPVGSLEITYSLTPVQTALHALTVRLAWTAVLGSILAALAAARLADRLVRPLTRLTAQVAHLSDETSIELTRSRRNDEIGRITNALANSYEELSKRDEKNRQMVLELREVTKRLSDELEINAALRVRLEEENRRLHQQVKGEEQPVEIIGEHGDLAQTVTQARSAAASRLSVLITGESGVGKEVIASMIHTLSDRASKNLVVVNCAALPETLIESELFGHEKGAFTGATATKPGKFMRADGGTIFLDEIGELPLQMQPKLLRVLEAREVDRIGADRPTPVDVRVVAATNRDLEREVAAGRFRQDLYFRLKVIQIEIPPLRSRPRDLPLLAESFLTEIADEMRIAPPVLSPAALTLLRSHPWPGNVRELRHILAAACSLHPEVVLEPEHLASVLPKHGSVVVPTGSALGYSPGAALDTDVDFDTRMGNEERRVLELYRGACSTQKEMAGKLRISEARLHRLLKKHGLLKRGDSWSAKKSGSSADA